ncbi:LysR family transcriptional regulator [Gulosibacter macacae]|uniref:LysR family transcriptional regulator n=1 Tax=Gulosibacter macacae TaxID=2488791 RepID=A0A3P3W3K0_9MICO|nr:LysR substrate-binding domain-containing protein [Gulosibacter macacae]RRJ88239.1 LysR family transcriptional regulator [Gulosibacter macacae]
MFEDVPPIPSPDVTLRQLECFVAVAEAGTITGAAARIHSSGSAVSDAVTSLERAIGVPLMIRRRSQGVTLTTTGESIVALAREVLARSTELESLARGDEKHAAPVRIGAFHTLAPTLLPRLISQFTQRHPDAEIAYVLDDQAGLAERLGSGELDVAVVYDLDFPLEYERTRLLRSRAVAVLPVGHRLAERASVQLRELADEPFILHDTTPSRQYVIEILNEAEVSPAKIHATTNYDLCRSLVGEGLGWSLLMSRRFAPMTWGGTEVVEVPVQPAVSSLSVVVAARNEPHPPRVLDLIASARTTSRELMGTGFSAYP